MRQSLPLLLQILVSSLVLLLLEGCGTSREEKSHEVRQDHKSIRTTTTTTETVPGDTGPVVARVVQTVTTTEEVANGETKTDGSSVTTLQLPPGVEMGAKIVMGAAKTVETVVEGSPWGGIAATGLAIVTALTGAYAAKQKTRGDGECRRADFHEKDSAEAWSKLEEALRKAPQEDV